MSVQLDFAPKRPENIEQILNGLDRYNPETTGIFQDYVQQQCEEGTYDCYANLALLKLYQFNPPLSRDETITNILVKALTEFPSPDFSLCLHLLPPHLLISPSQPNSSTPSAAAGDAMLAESVQKLFVLNTHLSSASYAQFWATLDSDDLYADLVADVSGFEELIRVRIAGCVGQAVRQIDRSVLEGWLSLHGKEFDRFLTDVCEWDISEDGKTIKVPMNKENEAKGTVIRENVKFDQFSKMIHRAYERPA